MVSSEYWFGAKSFYNGVATQSLRFHTSELTLTQNSTDPSDSTRGTLAFWVKRSLITQMAHSSQHHYLITTGSGSTNSGWFALGIDVQDELFLARYDDAPISTSAGRLYRDVSAWMHIALVWDSTDSTASNNKVKVYINGVRDTADTYGNIAQNDSFAITNRNQEIAIAHSDFSTGGKIIFMGIWQILMF